MLIAGLSGSPKDESFQLKWLRRFSSVRFSAVSAAISSESEEDNSKSDDDQEKSPEILPGEVWNEDGQSRHDQYDADYDSSEA